MERFVFIAAVTIAVLFGIGAVVGGPHISWRFDGEGGGTAPIVEVAPGSMASQAFEGSELRIKNAAAAVTILTEDRTDFLIEIDNNAGLAPMPTVAIESGRVVIDGQLRGRISNCTREGGASLRGYSDVSVEEMPRITIRAPRNLRIDRSGGGTTEIGATEELSLDFSGCGVATLGDVAGDLNLDFAGSGNVQAGSARSVNADIAGSGDLSLTTITGGADFDIAGSGTVTVVSLTGDLSVDSAGSGDVTIQGGSIGEANIDTAGSGDAFIAAPVRSLVVSMVGAGDIEVTGVVGDLEVEIAGAGSVTAASVTGRVRQEIFGPGDVTIGSRGAQNAP
jgi:hypothetical protein